MGILNNRGQISGRVGDKIYFITKNGQQGCRIAPKRSAYKPTAAQMVQQKRFGLAGSFIRSFLPLFQLLPKTVRKKGSPYPGAIRQVLANAISGEYPSFQIDYPGVQLFQGSIMGLLKWGAIKSDEGIQFSWVIDQWDYKYVEAIMVAYHPASRLMVHKLVEIRGLEHTHKLDVPVELKDDHFETWLVFVLRDQQTSGGSVYCGSLGNGSTTAGSFSKAESTRNELIADF